MRSEWTNNLIGETILIWINIKERQEYKKYCTDSANAYLSDRVRKALRLQVEEVILLKGSLSNEAEIWPGLKIWVKMVRDLSAERGQK